MNYENIMIYPQKGSVEELCLPSKHTAWAKEVKALSCLPLNASTIHIFLSLPTNLGQQSSKHFMRKWDENV